MNLLRAAALGYDSSFEDDARRLRESLADLASQASHEAFWISILPASVLDVKVPSQDDREEAERAREERKGLRAVAGGPR